MKIKFGIHKHKDISEIEDVPFLISLLSSNKKTIRMLEDPALQAHPLGFGQYADFAIKDLPDEYRKWLLNSSHELADALAAELERRSGHAKQQERIDALQRSLGEAQARASEWEVRARYAETQLAASERRARAAEKRATEAERRAGQLLAVAEESMTSIVQAGFRQLAQRHHPDHGGDTAVMRSLIDARDRLLQLASNHKPA